MRRALLLMACLTALPFARDGWSGPDDQFIHGRALDGGGISGLAQGLWAFHSGDGDNGISVVSGRAVMEPNTSGFEYIAYGLTGVTELGNDYAAEIVGQFHEPFSDDNSSLLGVLVRGNFSEVDPIRGYYLILNEQAENSELLILQFNGGVDQILAFTNTGIGPLDPDTDYTLRLCIQGTVLRGYLNGVETLTFDLATDTPFTGDIEDVEIFADGSPGILMGDLHGPEHIPPDPLVSSSEWTVYADVCEGPPENPYPDDPPPPVPFPVGDLWPKKQGLWVPVPIPTPEASQVYVRRHGVAAPVIGLAVKQMGRWIFPATEGIDQFPEPDTPLPPHYDPCEIGLPPPTPGDVEPTPFAGGRFYGLGSMPVTRIGSIFNAAKRPLGAWTPAEILQAVARGGKVICGPGGAKQFRTGGGTGPYSRALYFAFVEQIAATMGSTLIAAQTANQFPGLIIADDFRVPSIWPPSGLSYAELEILAAKWDAEIPGLRLGLRERPRVSQPVDGITFWDTQYDGPRQVGKTASTTASASTRVTEQDFRNWRDIECGVVDGWGGGRMVIMSVNYLHGGDGSSGLVWHDGTIFSGRFTMSPAEIMAAADGFFDDEDFNELMMGALGYQYQPAHLEVAGILDAMTYYRNRIMALPAL